MTQKENRDTTKISEQLNELSQMLEKNLTISASAYSTDGKTFAYKAPLSLNLPIGSYVTLTTSDDKVYFAQIITKDIHEKAGPQINLKIDNDVSESLPEGESLTHFSDQIQRQYIAGTGLLIGRFTDDCLIPTNEQDIFQDVDIQRAGEQVLTSYFQSASEEKASLEIGTALTVTGRVPVVLKADGFDRHTFLCGQSGSGKTFALGVIIEQLLLQTELKILVIDPNSDFVAVNQLRTREQINQLRSQPLTLRQYKQLVKRFEEIKSHLHICRPMADTDNATDALQIRLSDLDQRTQPHVFELDPLADREEFNSFQKIAEGLPNCYTLSEVQTVISSNFTAEARQLGLRIENLGIAQWDLWSPPGASSVTDILGNDWRSMVADIGTLPSAAEKSVATLAMLDHFWEHRQQKKPILIIVDEAHTICPQEPTNKLQTMVTDRIIQIAGEGRKFGLYLLLASQRPWKIHQNVLSQCENLILMHMNSNADLKHLAEILSQTPLSFLNQAPTFRRGEALLVGKMVQNPTFARFEGRLTHEGGNDIPATWANTSNK